MSKPITPGELTKLKVVGDFIFPKEYDDSCDLSQFKDAMEKLIPEGDIDLEKAYEDISGSKKDPLTFKKLLEAFLKSKGKEESEGTKLLQSLINDIVKLGSLEIEGSPKEAEDKIISSGRFQTKKFLSEINVAADKKGKIKGFKMTYDDSAKIKVYDESDKSIKEKLDVPLDLVDEKEYEENQDKVNADNEYIFRDSIPVFFGTMEDTLTSVGFKLRSGNIQSFNEPKGKPFLVGKEGNQLHVLKITTGDQGIRIIEPTLRETPRKNIKLKDVTVENIYDYLGIKPGEKLTLEEENDIEEEEEGEVRKVRAARGKRATKAKDEEEEEEDEEEEVKPKRKTRAANTGNKEALLKKKRQEEMEKVFQEEGEPLDQLRKVRSYYLETDDGYVLGVENGYGREVDMNLQIEGLEIVEPEDLKGVDDPDFTLKGHEKKAFYTKLIPDFKEDVTFSFWPADTE
ncbi:MAG: hypothetical protein MJ252_28745 [archaeon]|nr:hypothetical protein [archaeon]